MGAAAAAAIIARKEREIVETYRNVRAVNPAAARDPNDIGVHQHLVFERLVRRAVLREAGGGRYYLDEPSWQALRSMRRRLVLFVLVAAIIVLFAILLTGGAAALTHTRTK